jgi:saccharopine dehydrogenase-like NADP-dependent oxidoreductase
MKLLIIGCGGIGQSLGELLKQADSKNEWLKLCVLSDCDISKPEKKIRDLNEDRFKAERINAEEEADIRRLIGKYDVDTVINACDPSFNPVIFDAAFELGVTYIDLALSSSEKHPTDPFNKCGTMLGDYQFNKHEEWKENGLMAVVGIGVTPGITDVYAKYAAEYLMDEIDEIHIRCGGNVSIEDGPAVAFTWSPWTAIEECTVPPVFYDKKKGGFYTKEPFADHEVFRLPVTGDCDMASVEHEDVIMIAKHIDCNVVDFKISFGREFEECIKYLNALGLDRVDRTVKFGNEEIRPRDFVQKCAPDPGIYDERMRGKFVVAVQVLGKKDGLERNAVLYTYGDAEEVYKRYHSQLMVLFSAYPTAIAVELIAKGLWKGEGVLAPEALPSSPFIERMEEYGFPPFVTDYESEYKLATDREAVLENMKL